MKAKFTIGAFGIILNERKEVLLCHRRDKDLWNLPGGGVEENESPWEALVREVKEESGFDVKIKNLSGIYFKKEKGEVVFAFICEIVSGALTLNEEADAIEFFGVEKIPQNISKRQLERIIDAFNIKEDGYLGITYLKNQ